MPHSQLYAGGADSVDSDIMDKGGSFPSKASSQEQDLRVATIDIHLVFHHIHPFGKIPLASAGGIFLANRT